jgi:hypothetical protein
MTLQRSGNSLGKESHASAELKIVALRIPFTAEEADQNRLPGTKLEYS